MGNPTGREAALSTQEPDEPEKVQKIKAADIEVGAWVVNDRADIVQLLGAGVERLYTDHPRLLISLKSR